MLRLLLSLLLLITTATAWTAELDGIRLSQSENDTRLVFDLNNSINYKIFPLSNPDRIVIDLLSTSKPQNLRLPSLDKSFIKAIRYAVWDKRTLRVVLDVKSPLTFESQKLGPSQNHPYRLVVDLHSATAIEPEKAAPLPEQVAREEVRSQPSNPITPPLTIPKQEEVVTAPTAVVPVKTIKTLERRDIVIAIDAGHGGQDSGALGRRGTQEKDVVLAIAKRLARLVDKQAGMKAYLTRDRDVFIPLRHRIKRARDNHADMFISIHADAFKNKNAKGASVFVLSDRGASSEAAQLLADKENAADLAGGISLEDKDDLLASVLLDLSQTASLEGSLEVANTILAGLKRVGNVHKKHVESASFVVLKSPDIPSVLVETAFISNPSEESKLKSSSHQNKLARAIMSGIRNYFQRNPLPGSALSQQHIVSRGDNLSTISQRYQVSVAMLKQHNNLASSQLKIGMILVIP